MNLVEVLAVLILAPLGLCAVVCCVGWWSTVGARLSHQRRMFELDEQAKANAVTIEERRMAALVPPPYPSDRLSHR